MTTSNPAYKKTKKAEETRQKAKMNSVTSSVKPENQNQRHNAKQVALGPNTDRK